MKRRLVCLGLCLGLSLGLSPAWAAGNGFSDVSLEDWFAPYVDVCVEEGLMEGTGEGWFAPERELTVMEVLALEAKVRAWSLGETVPHFPAVDGLAVLYDGQGERLGTIGDCVYEPKVYYGYNTLYFALPPQLQERAGEGTVSLVIDLRGLDSWPLDPLLGYRDVLPREPVRYEGGWDSFRNCYTIEFGEDFGGEAVEVLKVLDGILEKEKALEGQWFRDVMYYNGCWDLGLFSARHEGPWEDMEERVKWLREEPAVRADILGLMEAMGFRQHEGLWRESSDRWDELDWEDVYLQGLRELGILKGVDEAGNMAPEGHLTRAEAAAVLARTLEPGLRATDGNYVLDPVELGDWQVWEGAADWLALSREGADGGEEGAVYRADGKVLDLEGGLVWFDGKSDLGDSWLAPVRRGDQWGVYDVEKEEFALPYTGWEEFDAWAWDRQGTPRRQRDWESGLWGYVDRADAWVVPARYEAAEPFRDGWAKVECSDGTEAVIDARGEVLIRGKSLENLGDGLFLLWDPDIPGGYFINGGLERFNLDPVKDGVWGNLVRGRVAWSGAGNGYMVAEDRYYSYEGEALTPWFEWAGPINDEGRGFVMDWGRVYRIRFQEDV